MPCNLFFQTFMKNTICAPRVKAMGGTTPSTIVKSVNIRPNSEGSTFFDRIALRPASAIHVLQLNTNAK